MRTMDIEPPIDYERELRRLSHGQERLMGIVGSATDAIITVDDRQRITLFNAAAERMFACTAAAALGSPLDRFIPVRFREVHRAHIHRFGETGVSIRTMGVHQQALMALRSDGFEFPVEATISQTTVDGQRLYTAIVRDITERQRAEAALRESEARLRAIVDHAVDGIITIDERGIVETFNPSAVRIFQYRPEEVIGRNIDMLMPSPYREEHDGYLDNYLRTGVKKIIGVGREVVGRRKDRSTFPMDLAVSEVMLGSRRLFTGIVRDISDRKRAEEALEKQAQELARSNVELERFAYVASHDLQEPMRTVSSFVQLLARRYRGQLESDADEYIDFITQGVGRMRSLIYDLLEYSRVNSRGGAFAPTDVGAVLQKVMEILHVTIEQHGATITFDALPTVLADPTQLGQLLQNLIGNAIKFHGPEPPRVHVSAVRREGEWLFSVTDNGIGIPAEYRERIFIIFQRLHTMEEYGGTGIGLAICKKIVERHGGHIWVESNPASGSTFYFTIPLRRTGV
jgi:two-component system sensor kinase FixL